MAKKASSSKQAAGVFEPAPLANVPRPRLHKLRVSNFRCIGPTPIDIELDDIVVLVGPNNLGKSCILRAYEVVMLHGSKEGELTEEDFPNGIHDPHYPPTIELETVVFEKTVPGERWVRTDPNTDEMFVREKWTWSSPGAPKKVGWEVLANDWHAREGPWGAPNVAQAYRPQPHRVGAFQKPEDQAAKVVDLLSKAITDRVKDLSKKKADEKGESGPSEVLTKANAAAEWCKHATEHERRHGGKSWTYLLIPHDAIADNKTLKGLAATYTWQDGTALKR